MGRPRKGTTTEAVPSSILEKYKDFAGIKVIERRLEHPDLPGSLPIRLKDEPTHADDPQGKKRIWYLRWINGAIDGRWSMVVDGLGYVAVKTSELQNPEAIVGLAKTEDGVVRRGDRGQEVLVKMPLELYNAVKQAQRDRRERRARNRKLVQSDLAEAAGQQLGDEAGETIHNEFSVEMRRHRTTLGEELEA